MDSMNHLQNLITYSDSQLYNITCPPRILHIFMYLVQILVNLVSNALKVKKYFIL
jgi:signal transduction histidine kinase